MNIELSNGLDHLFQWDTGQKVKVPENVPTVHFKWGNDAVSFDVVDGWVEIPPELTQKAGYILLWTYMEDHTLDAARIPVERRPKPDGYAYTPTEIKTWESLDGRITALEKGGGVAGVSSVNGQTGAVEITAKGLGALTEDDLQSATNAALAQAKASGEFDGATGPQGPAGAGLDVTGATVGQTVKISAVDANGVPTAWVPVDVVSGEKWEKIAEIDFNVDAANDVSVWEYKNLPNYKELAYRKVSLTGSTEKDSGISISINGSSSQPSAIAYSKTGGQSNGWGKILLLPFGWVHVNSGSANLPTNYSVGGLQAIYNAIQFSGDSITSVRLSGHTTYKIAGGKLLLYGRR